LHEAGESGTSFYLTQIVKSDLPWKYLGVLHEVIQCEQPHTTEKLEGVVCKGFFDSARNVDPIKKYAQDARVLEAALESEPDNARYVFYLAQSYRDSGQHDAALAAYARRAAMGGWAEEVWYSLFQIGALRERHGDSFGPALEAYLAAYQFRPTRAEPLCALARHYRGTGEYALAHLFASHAAQLPRPDDILFLDHTVYDWRAADELAVAAYYVGRHEQALTLANRLLASAKLPAAARARIEQNREFSLRHVGGETQKQRNRAKRKRRRR
jgi:tetratricopeptide (TPR) repeat protein